MKNITIAYIKVRNAYRYFRRNFHPKRVWGIYITFAVIPGSIMFDAWYHNAKEPVKYLAETVHAEEVRRPALIEIDYSKMDENRIEEIILAELPPIFVEIAKCEGGLRPHIEGPTNDHGPLQIHIPTHGERLERLGLDVINNPYDNIKFAKMLYEESGLQPWSASESCWNK